MSAVHDLEVFPLREFEGDPGCGIVHAVRVHAWGMKTACGWLIEDASRVYTMDKKTMVTCLQCIASGRRY